MKNFSRYVWLLIVPIIFSGCCWMDCCDDCEALGPEPECVKVIDAPEIVHAIQHFLPYLRHEKHLRLEDAGVYYGDYIHTIRMQFISMDVMEIREARMLLVDLVEGLLAELNQNPILAPEFITYPLTPLSLEIYIDFQSYYGMHCDPYFVGWMKLEKGTSYFYAFDLKYNGLNCWDFRTESYSKSLELTVYERESEQLFKQAVEIEENTPDYLRKEQYRPNIKCLPRYFPPYTCVPLF